MILPVVWSLKGLTVSEEERDFFKSNHPVGFILFDRNVKNPEQLKALTDDLRSFGNGHILIDQEGGRVQRLWPPYWESLPFPSTYGDWWVDESQKKAIKGVKIHAEKLSKMLLEVGIDVDCWPCFGVLQKNTHSVLEKRLFSDDEVIVSELGNMAVRTMLKHGLMPVAKHIPGYGRAVVDPHFNLPVIASEIDKLETDFYPFHQVNPYIWGMTSHVIYEALDKENPATFSEKVVRFIREEIGFKGPLITDDIGMGALSGSVEDKTKKSLDVGGDIVLYCRGEMEEMKKIAKILPQMSQETKERLDKAKKELLK